MEDTHICQGVELKGNKLGMLFGVFDGHGGSIVAEYVRDNFKNRFIGQLAFTTGDYR